MATETVIEKPDFSLGWDDTERGFRCARFVDVYGNECSIQESSSVMPRLWLGIDKPSRNVQSHDMSDADYAMLCSQGQRMHLAKSQALVLGRAMVAWAEAQGDFTLTDD